MSSAVCDCGMEQPGHDGWCRCNCGHKCCEANRRAYDLKTKGDEKGMSFKKAFKDELAKMAMARTFEEAFLDELTKLGLNKGDDGLAGVAVASNRVTGNDPKAPKTSSDEPKCPPKPGVDVPSKPGAIEKKGELIKEAPFKSQAQRRFLFARHPEIARRWAKLTSKGAKLPDHVQKKASNQVLMPRESKLNQPIPGGTQNGETEEAGQKRKIWKRLGNIADDVVMGGMNILKRLRE